MFLAVLDSASEVASVTEYADLKGINWSSLKHIATSPKLYQWRTTHPTKQTDAMVLGSAIHCAALEPSKFGERYAVYEGKRDARVKAYQEWIKTNPDVVALRPDDMECVSEVVQAILAHPVAAKILADSPRLETVMVWTDPETGLACKARTDILRPNFVTELKSAADISQRGFSQSAARMLYHAQLAWYHFGAIEANLLPLDAELPYFIAVESDEPYDVGVYQMSPAELAAGRTVCVELMDLLMACSAANYWPGQVPELEPLNLPKWARGMAELEVANV